MRCFARTLLLVAIALLWPIGARADFFEQRAIFLRSEPVTLPDGSPGEIRIVRGTGDFFSGPDGLLALDREGREIARSAQVRALTLICGGSPRSCHGYDHDKARLLLLSPNEFVKDGRLAPAFTEMDQTKIGEFEPGLQSHGFVPGEPTLGQRLQAELAQIRQGPSEHAVAFGAGLIATALLLVGNALPSRRTKAWLALWFLILVLRVAAAAYIAFVMAVLLLLGSLSYVSMLACTGIGSALAIIVAALTRRLRRAPVPAV